MSVEVRRLRADELRDALPLLAPEGWTFEERELARLHALGGAVGARSGGRLVGFLSYVDTPPYRWIGNVVVAPETRGQSVGETMVREILCDAEHAALYSVEKAVSLYARMGFVAAGSVLALRAPRARPERTTASPLRPDERDAAIALDKRATGMDRSRLLRALFAAYPALAVRDADRIVVGYAVAKTYDDVTELGPIVGPAAPLLDGLLATAPGPYELAAHEPNAALVAAAKARGFTEALRVTPMFIGGPPAWDLSAYGGVAGLEKG